MSKEEKDIILSYVVGSNQHFNMLINKIKDNAIKERFTNRLKSLANTLFETSSPNYESIMKPINMNIISFESFDLILNDDITIWFKNSKELNPNDQFNYTVEDIIVNKRIDIDFFEFVSISYLHRPGIKLEPYVNVFPDFITGVASSYNGHTAYNVTLKYTNFTDGGKHREIHSVFMLCVGPFPNENTFKDKTTSPLLIVGILVIVIVFISLSACLIYKRCYKSKAIKFVEIKNSS